MKKDWEIKKLGELTIDKMSYGTSSPSCEYDGETRYIRITDINDNGSLNEDFVSPISYEEKHILQDGDIVFARTGATVGKAYCYHSSDEKYVYAGYLIRLRPNKKIILPDYIYYYTKSYNYSEFIRTSQAAAAQPNVNAEKYSNLEIPVPPLEEQKRIVKILNEKFAQLETIKANAQTNLQNAKDLFQSQLTKAFSDTTWEKKRLGEVCSYFKKQGKYDDLPYIGMEDIESKTGIFIGSEEIKTVQSSTFFFEENDVLFGRLRPYLGKVYLAEFSGHCSTEIFPIRVNNSILPAYLKQWLLSENTINKINETCTGARMPRADMNEVLTFGIPLPPLPEQKRIVEELDTLSEKVRHLQEIYTKQIANCDELKQSLLQKAFEGDL